MGKRAAKGGSQIACVRWKLVFRLAVLPKVNQGTFSEDRHALR